MARQERAPHKQHDAAGKRIPVRSCVVCRQRFPQAELLRLTRDEAGTVQLDPKRSAAGRGFYICAKPTCHLEKPLMRVSRGGAARLSRELEAWFTTGLNSIHHRVAYEEISQSETAGA